MRIYKTRNNCFSSAINHFSICRHLKRSAFPNRFNSVVYNQHISIFYHFFTVHGNDSCIFQQQCTGRHITRIIYFNLGFFRLVGGVFFGDCFFSAIGFIGRRIQFGFRYCGGIQSGSLLFGFRFLCQFYRIFKSFRSFDVINKVTVSDRPVYTLGVAFPRRKFAANIRQLTGREIARCGIGNRNIYRFSGIGNGNHINIIIHLCQSFWTFRCHGDGSC